MRNARMKMEGMRLVRVRRAIMLKEGIEFDLQANRAASG
jgi:hypothetical protein